MNVITDPGRHDHFVQLYQDSAPLAEAVAEYIGTGLARGEAAIVIARPEHRAAFLEKLENSERLRLLDAQETLERFMVNGMPRWTSFHEVVGGLIADLRLQYPAVRAYGEMVDVLWQRGEREAAIRLEEYWNELGRLQAFSLFCAYRMDPLDATAYGGPLESVCKVHTHVIPARDAARYDDAVRAAIRKVLDQPLCDVLFSLVPTGQAALFWLNQNMPRTAQKILSEARAGFSSAA